MGSLLAKGNLTSVLEELAELKRGIGRIVEDVVQVQEKMHNITGDLMAKGDLTSVLEELTELKRENGGIAEDVVQVLGELHNLTGALMANGNLTSVLEELAELKSGNGRLAKGVIQVQEELHNLTDFFCLSCPDNWQHFQRNCYFFSTLRGSWTSAKQSCEREGAHLVIVNNKAEQTFLAGQMINDEVAWIGLSDAVAEGKWLWVDGTPITLSFWRSGEPNNAGQKGEDCATLRSEGKWNDAHCSSSDLWICERKC
ncbi:hypothetical protein lerEdw1_016372 [Lerista edwardsae]|nr:hypothetical protein lerEdw1_016372 [Lerista edwardsae]